MLGVIATDNDDFHGYNRKGYGLRQPWFAQDDADTEWQRAGWRAGGGRRNHGRTDGGRVGVDGNRGRTAGGRTILVAGQR